MRISSNKDAGLDLLGRYQYNGGKTGANSTTNPAGNCEATNAVVFGDFSASSGWIGDFRLAAAALKPLSDAGIALTLGM